MGKFLLMLARKKGSGVEKVPPIAKKPSLLYSLLFHLNTNTKGLGDYGKSRRYIYEWETGEFGMGNQKRCTAKTTFFHGLPVCL